MLTYVESVPKELTRENEAGSLKHIEPGARGTGLRLGSCAGSGR